MHAPSASGIFLQLYAFPPRIWLFAVTVALKLPLCLVSETTWYTEPVARTLLMLSWPIWFGLLFLVAMPETDLFLSHHLRWFKKAALGTTAALLILSVAGLLALIAPAVTARMFSWSPAIQSRIQHSGVFGHYTDGPALVSQAATNLLKGENPYSTANIVEAYQKDPAAWWLPTPLQTGDFSRSFPFPSEELRKQVWGRALEDRSPVPVELESRLCYPAGSFLLVAPFMSAGVQDLRVIYLILMLAALAVTTALLPSRSRLFFILGALMSIELWYEVANAELMIGAFIFLLPAWILRQRHPWWAVVLVGIAVCIKHQAWLVACFFLIEILRNHGWRTFLGRAGILAGIFLAVNLPFLLQDPRLWLTSVTAPMVDPMFPLGIGFSTLVYEGFLDGRWPVAFAVLEAAGFTAAFVWYYRNCRRYPQTGPLLAVVPLFFAWRSLTQYFLYVDILILAGVLADCGIGQDTNQGRGFPEEAPEPPADQLAQAGQVSMENGRPSVNLKTRRLSGGSNLRQG
jgi:hypothetical protein